MYVYIYMCIYIYIHTYRCICVYIIWTNKYTVYNNVAMHNYTIYSQVHRSLHTSRILLCHLFGGYP